MLSIRPVLFALKLSGAYTKSISISPVQILVVWFAFLQTNSDLH